MADRVEGAQASNHVAISALPIDRMTYQRQKVQETTGVVLNVGCHVDPAGLKTIAPDRVFNCDIRVQPGYDYEIDYAFDARERWPFEDDSVELVVIADVMEHWYDHEIEAVLAEARRVSEKLCLTVPYDDLLQDEIDPEAQPRSHCNTIDESKLKLLLSSRSWNPIEFLIGSYPNWSPKGFLVLASTWWALEGVVLA